MDKTRQFILIFLLLSYTALAVTVVEYKPFSSRITSHESCHLHIKNNINHIYKSLSTTSYSELIVLPEYGLTGLSLHSFNDSFHCASDLSSTCPILKELHLLADSLSSTLVINIPVSTIDQVFNSLVTLNSTHVISQYRKEHLYGAEPWYFHPGSPSFNDQHSCFVFNSIRYCTAICFDTMFPSVYDRMLLKSSSSLLASVAWVNFPPLITSLSTFNGLSTSFNISIYVATLGFVTSSGSLISRDGNVDCFILTDEGSSLGNVESCSESGKYLGKFESVGEFDVSTLDQSFPVPKPISGKFVTSSGQFSLTSNDLTCVFSIVNPSSSRVFVFASRWWL
ncbi:hypothetical protein GEMRC1_011909 [Eukaryota sp. GEM-RC1]